MRQKRKDQKISMLRETKLTVVFITTGDQAQGFFLYDLQSFQKQSLFQEKTPVRHYILKGQNISQHSDKNNIQCHYQFNYVSPTSNLNAYS